MGRNGGRGDQDLPRHSWHGSSILVAVPGIEKVIQRG